MQDFKLAAIQIDTIPGEVAYNVHKAMGWAFRALAGGAKYVFFHESLTADYTAEPVRHARPLESSEVYGFEHIASRLGGYIALGLNELWQGRPYISTVWIGPQGVIGVYRKSYLWPNDNQLENAANSDEFLRNYIPYRAGYRLERGVLACGDGTKVFQVGELRIGTLICADGSQERAWEPFRRDKPDLIVWANNCHNVRESVPEPAKERGVPIVATNRVGLSHHFWQAGGSRMVASDGSVVAAANEKGEEEMIFARWSDLRRG